MVGFEARFHLQFGLAWLGLAWITEAGCQLDFVLVGFDLASLAWIFEDEIHVMFGFVGFGWAGLG